MPYIIGLCKKNPNFEFHILSFEKPERFRQNKETINQLIDEYNIHWHPEKYTKSPPVLATVYDILKMLKQTSKLHKKNRFEIIHCRSYISALAGLRMKKKYGIKFIFDMRGFWADERVDGNLWDLKNPVFKAIYNFFKQKEKEFLQYADAVISLTEAAKQEMLQWKINNLTKEKITVIPCAADFEHFNPNKITEEEKKAIRKKLNIKEDTIVLTYLGSLGTWYMLDEMLDFYKEFEKKFPDSVFLFITKDNPQQIIKSAQKRSIETKKIIITSAERNNIPKYISISNLGIFFIKPVYSKKASSPVKMGEFLAMNIPVIVNTNVGDNDFILNKIEDVISIDLANPSKKEIKKVNDLLTKKSNLRNIANHSLSLETAINTYYNLYKQLSEKN